MILFIFISPLLIISCEQRTGSVSRSEIEEPEDAVGGLYGDHRPREPQQDPTERREQADREIFEHQF